MQISSLTPEARGWRRIFAAIVEKLGIPVTADVVSKVKELKTLVLQRAKRNANCANFAYFMGAVTEIGDTEASFCGVMLLCALADVRLSFAGEYAYLNVYSLGTDHAYSLGTDREFKIDFKLGIVSAMPGNNNGLQNYLIPVYVALEVITANAERLPQLLFSPNGNIEIRPEGWHFTERRYRGSTNTAAVSDEAVSLHRRHVQTTFDIDGVSGAVRMDMFTVFKNTLSLNVVVNSSVARLHTKRRYVVRASLWTGAAHLEVCNPASRNCRDCPGPSSPVLCVR